jgi:hypothetical protein
MKIHEKIYRRLRYKIYNKIDDNIFNQIHFLPDYYYVTQEAFPLPINLIYTSIYFEHIK